MAVSPLLSIHSMADGARTRVKDGVAWPVGEQSDVDWINLETSGGLQISSAIPPVFEDYATLEHPGDSQTPRDLSAERRHDLALLGLLRRHAAQMSWWLGYLDTGASDVVFRDIPKVTLYANWHYALVLAGPDQAATWRPAPGRQSNWKSTELPDLMFPADRAWLVSTLWDDDWTCIGGPRALIDDLLQDPVLAANTRRVTTHEDATPPGHTAL
jgi:hypothetical protein